jgi:cephalosporin-C deacetylase-like acetyl esterase
MADESPNNHPLHVGIHRRRTVLLIFVRQSFVALLGLIALFQATLRAQDARWAVAPDVNALEDYRVLPASTALTKALTDAAEYVQRWTLPKDANAWRDRRPRVEQALRKAIGLEKLPERTPLNPRTIASHDMGDYTLENLVFYSRPDLLVTANLYRPKITAPGKHPAIVCPLGHSLDHGKADREYQIFATKLAQLGFVVLIYDAIGHGERLISGNIHHEAGFALLPLGQTIAGWMVWETMRAIDLLSTLPEVDPARIGVTGNSGGGLNTLFTAALDERVRAATIAGYVYHFDHWIKYAGSHCTCCYLPALYRSMEWFEIASLTAPRALLMLQGERDDIFAIVGARKAGRETESVYSLLGYRGLARFDEVPAQHHAYSQPFRERLYGWMLLHLMGKGDGQPLPEGSVQPLPEDDERLLCDKNKDLMNHVPSVVELARRQAQQAISSLSSSDLPGVQRATRRLISQLAEPPDPEPHYLMPLTFEKAQGTKGIPEKIFFLSEDGQHVPGLLWLPSRHSAPPQTIVIVNDKGKSAVAESGMIEPLLQKGFAVLSVDLRGRGETLGKSGDRFDNNFHLAAHSVMWGRPIVGRRTLDLKRTLDFVATREDLSSKDLVVVGIGEEALTALLAAADDPRIKAVVCAGYYNSFLSQMVAAKVNSRAELVHVWNSSAMLWGRLDAGVFKADLGSVIPSVLLTADLPEIASLVFPRKLLYCQARDSQQPESGPYQTRFKQVLASTSSNGRDWAWYYPDRTLDTKLLLEWLAGR